MILGYIDPGTGFTITSIGGILIVFLSGFLGFLLLFLKRLGKFFKKCRKPVIIVLVLIAVGLTGFILFEKMQTSDFDKKVIIIGFDALSPDILEPLMAQGRLPNFQRLAETGSYSHLTTTNPPESPVAWSGFSTGQNPGKNGIFDFIVRDPKTYEISLCLAKIEGNKARPVIQTKRFWQYTSQKRIPTVILTCPVTFPPDKIYGRMLSGMGVPDILGTEGTFSFYTTAREIETETTGGKVFCLKRSDIMITELIGPKVAGIKGKSENAKLPMKITLSGSDGVDIAYQKSKLSLKTGQWSDWQTVNFDLGFLRKMSGIFKFYLVEPVAVI